MAKDQNDPKPEQRLLDSIDSPADLKELSDEQLQQGGPGGPRARHRHDRRDRRPLRRQPRHLRADGRPAQPARLADGQDPLGRRAPAYPHKILTGRKDALDTIRQYEGLAPFCSVFESEHDIMGAGHASTSIGYGVGLKEAMRKGIGEDGKVVAVIGDGALTGGVAYEALHHAGGLQTPMVIVLNDNGMSISPNVGALSRYFQRVRLNPGLYKARSSTEERLTQLPLGLGRRIERLGPEVKAAIKAYWAPGLFFEELDLAYMGVIDGHDVAAVRMALRKALEADRPVVVHINTVKGKGFQPAEEGGLEGMEKVARGQARQHRQRQGGAEEADSGLRVGLPGEDRETREAAAQGAAAVHRRLRGRPGGGGKARRASDRDHSRDGRRHRTQQAP